MRLLKSPGESVGSSEARVSGRGELAGVEQGTERGSRARAFMLNHRVISPMWCFSLFINSCAIAPLVAEGVLRFL